MALQNILDEAGIKHFSIAGDHRILSPVERGGRGIVVPPQELWSNIIGALQLADIVRDAMGMPVTVVSGYRTPEYDASRGRHNDSQHHHFRALDLAVPSVHYPRLRTISRAVVDAASLAGWHTGWGHYDGDNFVHIDTGVPGKPKRRWG